MISIIVCSNNNTLYQKFSKNIAEHIGYPYEIVCIDNTVERLGICEVYNNAEKIAKGKLFCFCHEDILINTKNWGIILNSVLQEAEIGLLGVAGAQYKSYFPSAWVQVPNKYFRTNITQVKRDGGSYVSKIQDEGPYSPVSVIDGCFIAGRREIFEKYKWNEKDLKGFHMYDIDICMQVNRTNKIVVSNLISVIHFSEGNFDESWLLESELFHFANRKNLPLNKLNLDRNVRIELDYFSLNRFINLLIHLKQPHVKILKYLILSFMKYPSKYGNLKMTKAFILSFIR